MSESSPSNETCGGGILVVVEGDAAIPGVSGPIVPDNPRLLDSERFGKSMNADGGGFHVQTIGRNGRLSDPRQIQRNHRRLFAQHRYYWRPHARRLRIAMQQDERCAMAAPRVISLTPATSTTRETNCLSAASARAIPESEKQTRSKHSRQTNLAKPRLSFMNPANDSSLLGTSIPPQLS